MNSHFMELLDEKIALFRHSFIYSSRKTFVDPSTGLLFHAGEFGSRRESLLKDLLRLTVPSRLQFGTGFLINCVEERSTQVDIVVYDSSAIPRIESLEHQRFFPVEGVVGIGEVKSMLTKHSLREALIKLAAVKKTADAVSSTNELYRDKNIKNIPFARDRHPYDQLFSFLVCEGFDFDPTSLADEVNDWYGSDIKQHHRHNMILSIRDGLLLYKLGNKPWMYPTNGSAPSTNRFIGAPPGSDRHFHIFSLYVNNITTSATILIPELINYTPPLKEVINFDEREM